MANNGDVINELSGGYSIGRNYNGRGLYVSDLVAVPNKRIQINKVKKRDAKIEKKNIDM